MQVPEQIVVLLALNRGLFDTIPIDKMEDAMAALLKIDEEIPDEIMKRMLSDKDLSNPDREAILNIAGTILTPFQDRPDPNQNK